MNNKNNWIPTKFILERNQWKVNPLFVGVGSQIAASSALHIYKESILENACGLLLDLGCGFVPFYGLYKNLVNDNMCVDWQNSLHKNTYLDLEIDLNKEIPLNSEQFDSILCTDVLEHIYNHQLLVSEIARMLKPNGKVILGVPFYYWIHESPHDYYRYTEFALKRILHENNLSVTSIEPFGGVPEILSDIIIKSLSNLPILQKILFKILKFILSFKIVKKISKKSSVKFPLGYCIVATKKCLTNCV